MRTTKKPPYRDVYAVMCWMDGKWTRVGKIYHKKSTASEWRSFAAAANGARQSKVERIRLEVDEHGKLTMASQQMMSDVYNVEVG